MTLFDDLKAAIGETWEAYTRHEFVTRLGEGSLPLPVFQDYLVQDYRFLTQFARANALAAYKGRTLAEIREGAEALSVILEETELHRRLTARWGIPEPELDAAPEKMATVAYTRYVLDAGQSGDLLDLHVALAPCVIGYAEIGAALEPRRHEGHPYGEWIAEYSGEAFQAGAAAAVRRLDSLAEGALTERRFGELVRLFRAATRLETDFWQQAVDAQ
ncbi:TenA family protein [Gulosibacter sp. 10]|uniref:TenA family protein n=1 Tax=Gulosibacter sp. 10 TaxID=1255570 RepID=UPI00097EAF54|nr:TenA family protein [Gulosibacter sp. 10]SJM55888.1 Thiaminase II involved in salvage of thiamin pyrimidine moiety [Gulosibacter sp. 10]